MARTATVAALARAGIIVLVAAKGNYRSQQQ